jgi:signal transduction histidine kinase
MVEHRFSRVSWAALLACGLLLSLMAGYAADRYWQDRLLRQFNARVADVFDLTGQALAEYETKLKTAFSQYEANRILSKGGFSHYLNRLKQQPYPGLADLKLVKTADHFAPGTPPFDEEWGQLNAPVSARARLILLWHVPLYPITAPVAAPITEAVETRFELLGLFDHVFAKARLGTLKAKVFVEGDHVFQGFRHQPAYATGNPSEMPAGPLWSETTLPFAAANLRIFLYDRPAWYLAHGLGLAVAALGFALIGWLVWNLRAQHQHHLQDQRSQHQQAMTRYERAESMAFIAHELAQPLSGVLGCVEGPLAWLEQGQTPVEVLRRDLTQAQDHALRACAVLDEIRSHLGPGHRLAQLQAVDLAELFQRLQDWAKGDEGLRGIRLLPRLEASGLRVSAHGLALELVLRNLLRNAAEAIQQSGQGSTISLSASADAEKVSILVCDDGPGLREPETLFTPFKTDKPQGMGMRLVYCERRVRDFGGSIQGGNGADGGAWFAIKLDREP